MTVTPMPEREGDESEQEAYARKFVQRVYREEQARLSAGTDS
jgi:hypothetical protein